MCRWRQAVSKEGSDRVPINVFGVLTICFIYFWYSDPAAVGKGTDSVCDIESLWIFDVAAEKLWRNYRDLCRFSFMFICKISVRVVFYVYYIIIICSHQPYRLLLSRAKSVWYLSLSYCIDTNRWAEQGTPLPHNHTAPRPLSKRLTVLVGGQF